MKKHEIDEELNRVIFEAGEQVVTINALEEFNSVIDDVKIHLIKGKEAKVPAWVAQVLINRKIGEMPSGELLTVPELNRVVRQEGSFALQKIDDLLYVKARQEMARLSRKTNQLAYRNQLAIRGLYEELIRKRLTKLLKIAEKGDSTASTIKNLIPEEKWLFNQILAITSNWKEALGEQATPVTANKKH